MPWSKTRKRLGVLGDDGILVWHRMIPEDFSRTSPHMLGACRIPRVTPDGPAMVNGREKRSSKPHAKFQFRNKHHLFWGVVLSYHELGF